MRVKAITHRDNCQPEVERILSNFDTKGWKVLELGPWHDTQFRDLFVNKYGMVYRAIDQVEVPGVDWGKMEDLSRYPDNSFDFVYACHAFEHTERAVDTLREVQRVLKKGGYMLFVTPQYCWHHVIGADHDHINVLTEEQMMRLLHYTKWGGVRVYTQKEWNWKEQDWNMISVARK